MSSAILGPTLKALAEQTGSSLDQISILFAVKSLGFLLGSFVVGRAYDRIPAHPIMTGALVGMIVMMMLVPFIGWLPLLGGVMLLLGLSMGSVDVGGNTLIAWVHREKIGPYMNGLHFIWGVGGVLSPLILIGLAYLVVDDVRWTYWLIALYLVPLVFWLVRIPSPQPLVSTDDSKSGIGQLPFVVLVTVFYFLNIGAEVCTSGWIVTYATETKLVSETAAAFLSSLFFGSLTLTRLITIPFAARFRPSQILIFDLAICLLSALIMGGDCDWRCGDGHRHRLDLPNHARLCAESHSADWPNDELDLSGGQPGGHVHSVDRGATLRAYQPAGRALCHSSLHRRIDCRLWGVKNGVGTESG